LQSNTWRATPPVILGILSTLGALFCMMLPETLGRVLPVTLEDGERFGEDDSWWEFSVKPKDIEQQEKTEKVTSKL